MAHASGRKDIINKIATTEAQAGPSRLQDRRTSRTCSAPTSSTKRSSGERLPKPVFKALQKTIKQGEPLDGRRRRRRQRR